MKSRIFSRLVALACLAVSVAAHGADGVAVSNAWVRATAPGQEVGAGYMDLESNVDATLFKVESPAADTVEIHMMSMKEGVMEMRMMENLPLPAGKMVRLEPGGFHLMLIDLKQPLRAGETVRFLLHVKDDQGKTSQIEVSAPVKRR